MTIKTKAARAAYAEVLAFTQDTRAARAAAQRVTHIRVTPSPQQKKQIEAFAAKAYEKALAKTGSKREAIHARTVARTQRTELFKSRNREHNENAKRIAHNESAKKSLAARNLAAKNVPVMELRTFKSGGQAMVVPADYASVKEAFLEMKRATPSAAFSMNGIFAELGETDSGRFKLGEVFFQAMYYTSVIGDFPSRAAFDERLAATQAAVFERYMQSAFTGLVELRTIVAE